VVFLRGDLGNNKVWGINNVGGQDSGRVDIVCFCEGFVEDCEAGLLGGGV
jgi:hypothetical protein